MHCVSFGDGREVTREEALEKAELCDELNRKHRESECLNSSWPGSAPTDPRPCYTEPCKDYE